MKKTVALSLYFYSILFSVTAQVTLYEDQFQGGVTGGSFSTGVSGTGNGVINLHIDPASTIRKAYLIAGRLGPAAAFTVTLNALLLTFDASNQATPAFNCSLYGGLSAVHAIDITSQISPAVNTYNISYSQGGSGANFFTDFYLYVAYENNALPMVNTVIFLKTLDFIVTEQYTLNLVHPIDTLVPVGFAMHAGYMCDSSTDGENITVASTLLGDIGGGDPNNPASLCAGTAGSFYYENNTLFGLNGDSADQAMHGNDALSDMKSLVPNMTTSFDVQFEHFGGFGSSPDNSMWAWIMAYGNSNVQPTALFASPNHICPGTCTDFTNHSVYATSYQWFFSGGTPAVSTDINPSVICYNSPGQYDVMLIATNANGIDTLLLQNYITVYPYPAPQGITQSGDTLFANAGAISYQWYQGGNLIPGATEYFYVAQGSGNYNVVATDANGCEVEAAIFDVIAEVKLAIGNMQLAIFPNPVENKLMIHDLYENSNRLDIGSIVIYNSIGERVLAVPLQTVNCQLPIEVDCRLLPPGVYWIEFILRDKMVHSKFLKK
ncbi:MAG: T9SS type A sorting domain-containing protein [Bacteroidota bacterium]